jgi:RecA-family ATPase
MELNKDEKRLLMEVFEAECFINPLEKITHPKPAISFGVKSYETKDGKIEYPTPIGTYGNFSFVQAPPKSKKTFFVSLLSAIYLADDLEQFGGDLKANRDNKHLIHFDTEQSNFHASVVFKRPIDMTGIKTDKYHTLALRQLSFKERVEFIEYYLYDKLEATDIGLVIIDGIADLCSDVNNIEESNAVVQKLMKWSKELDCHIVTVIHSNFGTDKPTGHLGSFLEKKTETQIQLELNTVNKGLVTVSCKRSRNAPFENFSFKVNNFGLPQVEGAFYDPLKDIF